MKRRYVFGMGAGGILLVLACGGATTSQASSSSHWITCEVEDDCLDVPSADACERGYCVDESGERIATDALESGDTTSGTNGSSSSLTSSGDSGGNSDSTGSGTSSSGAGGTGAIPDPTFGATSTSGGTGGAPLGFGLCDVDMALLTCQGSVCHGVPGVVPSSALVGGGLDLFRPDRATWLPDRPATYQGVTDTAYCPSPPELLVDTQSPSDSLILKKIEGRQSCGLAEPEVGTLAAADQLCITDWVNFLAASSK